MARQKILLLVVFALLVTAAPGVFAQFITVAPGGPSGYVPGAVYGAPFAPPPLTGPGATLILAPPPPPNPPAAGYVVDALSSGTEAGSVYMFSVTPGSVGLPGSAVNFEVTLGTAPSQVFPGPPIGPVPPEAQGDIFASMVQFTTGLVHPTFGIPALSGPLVVPAMSTDEFFLGLNVGPIAMPGDNLNAIQYRPLFSTPVGEYYSLAAGGLGASPFGAADIIGSLLPLAAPNPWAPAAALGLAPGDDINALIVQDVGPMVGYMPGMDFVAFSLAPGSPTLAAIGALPGDLLIAMPAGPPIVFIPGATLGLAPMDVLDAIDVVQAPNVTWTGTSGTTWSNTANWTPVSTPDGVIDTFDDTATGTLVNITTAAMPTSVVFNNSTKNFMVIGTGAVGIAGATTTVTKQGTGIVTMSSANTYGGVTTVQAGKLVLSGTARAMAPVLTGAGANIMGGMLVYDYMGEANPSAIVNGLITTSYSAGAWNTGTFQSSTADATHGLGWVDNTATSKISIAYTIYGDVDLNGTVGLSDLGKVLTNWGVGSRWGDGDVDYNAAVGLSDLGKVLTNWGLSVGMLTPSSVPEPSSLAMLAVLAGLATAWAVRRK